MYTENTNNNGGLIKSIILKLLFVALFIFLLLWLYPMPNTKPFYDAIFNENINLMKEVAEDYYTVQRLPKKIGEKDKLTLKEMLEMKLLLPFVDKNGEYCDNEKSYVQVTKLENDEYELKVNLSCKDQSDYIIEYLGCHDLCKNGECQKVVEIIEYKFERTLLKGRKQVNVDLYEYEYTKNEKQAYQEDKQVTYYKGKKKASENTYKYKYTKVETENYIDSVDVTYYKGRKQTSTDVYSYEYIKTTTKSTPSCQTYYNQSSVPSNATNVTRNSGTITVNNGGSYGAWTTTSTYTSSSPCATSSSSTSRTISGGYSVNTGKCAGSNCPSSTITYTCIAQSRTYTPSTTTVDVTTYTYQICTSNQTSDTQTTWSTEDLTKSGWTRTNNKKLVSSASYVYTDWVTVLPAGYEKTNTKVVKEQVTKTRTVTKEEWSAEDLTAAGWTRTNEKELIKAEEYIYTDWVTVLPEGYEQTEVKTVTEKVTKYNTVTKTEWSKEDLTKSGWTKTGQSKKVGTTTKYVYTDWVTKLPAGYEQIDKKVETKWSTEKSISGWKLTKDTRVKDAE